MEGTLKADLRNARTFLGLFEDSEATARLGELVHDVTVGQREQCPATVDLDALRRHVEDAGPAAARAHRVAEDTMRQLSRSLERVLVWWRLLPDAEPMLDDARWPTTDGTVLEIRITSDERFRLLGLQGTRDAIRARFEKYLSKHPHVEWLRLVDGLGDPVFLLVSDQGAIKLAG